MDDVRRSDLDLDLDLDGNGNGDGDGDGDGDDPTGGLGDERQPCGPAPRLVARDKQAAPSGPFGSFGSLDRCRCVPARRVRTVAGATSRT